MRARRTACVVFVCVCAGFGSAQSSKSFVFAACCFIIAFRFKNPLVSWNCREEPKSETELRRLYNTLTHAYTYIKSICVYVCVYHTLHLGFCDFDFDLTDHAASWDSADGADVRGRSESLNIVSPWPRLKHTQHTRIPLSHPQPLASHITDLYWTFFKKTEDLIKFLGVLRFF